MSWVAVGASAATLGGALIGSSSAKKASQAQTEASKEAIAEQRAAREQSRQDLRPYSEAGRTALAAITSGLGLGARPTAGATYQDIAKPIYDRWAQLAGGDFNALPPEYRNQAYTEAEQAWRANQGGTDNYGEFNKPFTVKDFWSDPVTELGYQSGLEWGQKAINNMAGAQGLRRSGQTIKEMLKFGTDYTGGKAAESSSRFYGDQDRRYNRLAGVSGTGQMATTTNATQGPATAGTIGNIMTGAGDARGAAAIARGNAWGGALNTVGNWWQQQQLLNRLAPQSSGNSWMTGYRNPSLAYSEQ